MSTKYIDYRLHAVKRNEIRKEIVNVFLNEEHGMGTGDLCTKYYYTVERHNDTIDYSIVLRRPAPLNKGFDFIVLIEGLFFKKNRRYNAPSHGDIINALINVQLRYSKKTYSLIQNEIANIFNCKTYDLSVCENVYFEDFEGNLHPIAIIILAMKWLFIEQDITYWNWSGRNMLWNAMKENDVL